MKKQIIHFTKDSSNFMEGETLQQYIDNSPESFTGSCLFCYLYTEDFPVDFIMSAWARNSYVIMEVEDDSIIELEQKYPGDDDDEFAEYQDEYIIKIENFSKVKILNVF